MPGSMENPPTCRTCGHWDQRYPDNRHLGVCRWMGVTLWPDHEVAIHMARHDQPTTDVAAVRTLDDFGCRYHTDYLLTQM